MKFGKVQINGGFLLLVAILLIFDNYEFIVPLAISIAVHEMGHYIALKLLGGKLLILKFDFVGLDMECDNSHISYLGEFIIAMAGPLSSFILAYLFAFYANSSGNTDYYFFSGVSFVLGLFNSMPVKQLDGGRAIYMLVAFLFGSAVAEIVSCIVSCVAIFMLLTAGLMLFVVTKWNFTLLAFAIWLLMCYCKKERYSIKYTP